MNKTHAYLSRIGRLGGKSRSPAKVRAARISIVKARWKMAKLRKARK